MHNSETVVLGGVEFCGGKKWLNWVVVNFAMLNCETSKFKWVWYFKNLLYNLWVNILSWRFVENAKPTSFINSLSLFKLKKFPPLDKSTGLLRLMNSKRCLWSLNWDHNFQNEFLWKHLSSQANNIRFIRECLPFLTELRVSYFPEPKTNNFCPEESPTSYAS